MPRYRQHRSIRTSAVCTTAEQADVDALAVATPRRRTPGACAQARARRSVGEPRTDVVGVQPRGRARQVDVVADDISVRPSLIQAAGGIRQNDEPGTGWPISGRWTTRQPASFSRTCGPALGMAMGTPSSVRGPGRRDPARSRRQPAESANMDRNTSRRPARRAQPSTIPTAGTMSVRARTAASSAARRAGCSDGGIGRAGSKSVMPRSLR
jgi:hypothetical protein